MESPARSSRKGCPLDLFDTIAEAIDLRSFSNLWYWIGLAVLWSSVAHFVLGVPYDLMLRARRKGGQAVTDMEMLADVSIRRILYIADTAGLVLAGLAAFSVSSLAILGWVYDAEFAQAVFCLAFPMVFVGWLTVRSARSIAARDLRGEDLYRALFRHRLACQGIGMVAILGTTMWGMWVNLAMSSAFGF
jgi:hypothetical protein